MLKIAFDPIYKHQLKVGHRFPMEKYELLPEQLLRKNICNYDNFFSPTPIKKQLLLSTHDEGYYNNLINLSLPKLDARQIGFPLSDTLIKRELVIAQGTISAVPMYISSNNDRARPLSMAASTSFMSPSSPCQMTIHS